MFQKAVTNTIDFSTMLMSIVDYFRPHRDNTSGTDLNDVDQPDAEMPGGVSVSDTYSSTRTTTHFTHQSSSSSRSTTHLAHQSSTSEKAYRFVRALVVRLRQLLVSLIYLTWRFLALHTHKAAMLVLFVVSLSQVSAAYLLLLLMAVVASPLPGLHRVTYPLITFYLGLLATAKVVYQAPLLHSQYFNLTTNCYVGVSFDPLCYPLPIPHATFHLVVPSLITLPFPLFSPPILPPSPPLPLPQPPSPLPPLTCTHLTEQWCTHHQCGRNGVQRPLLPPK